MGVHSHPRLFARIPVNLFALFIALIVLSSCQSIPKQPDRCTRLGGIDFNDFILSGKLALSDGREGGSGRFSWQQQGSQVTAEFKAPLGQGDWLIKESDHGASLFINNEEPHHAQQAETLIEEAVGWSVPWQALKKWLVAQPVNSHQAKVVLNQTSKTITEQGWTIVYDRFQDYPNGCLPHRIMASNPPYSIRLVIRKWQR